MRAIGDTAQTRRRFQFRLRTLLLLMVVVSLAFGWVMTERRRIRERREFFAASEIFDFSIGCGLGSQSDWGKYIFGDDWPSYSGEFMWYQNYLYRQSTRHVESLAERKKTVRVPWSNRFLFLTGPHVTDVNIQYLSIITRLEYLELVNTSVTDYGVSRLRAAMPHCKIEHYLSSEPTDYPGPSR